jgi:predicted porin
VKAAHVGGDGDISVSANGPGFGGHALGTSGTADMVVGYSLPSVGGLGINLSYAPNSAGTGLDSSEFKDTFGIGVSMSMDMLSLSAGFESAESSDTTCWTKEVTVTAADQTAAALLDSVYGTDICGDESLMVIGASMNAAGMAINAGWSELDSEEADRQTTSINVSTSVSDYTLNVGWTNSVKSSALAGADTEQTTIGGSIGTSLGDGVDLTVKFASNEYDDESQAVARGGKGATNHFYGQVELAVNF